MALLMPPVLGFSQWYLGECTVIQYLAHRLNGLMMAERKQGHHQGTA